MENDLKKKILYFLEHFDSVSINNYFANDFDRDWDNYLKNNTPIEVLEYLNDSFIDIDIDYRDNDNFDKLVRNVLKTALNMLDAK